MCGKLTRNRGLKAHSVGNNRHLNTGLTGEIGYRAVIDHVSVENKGLAVSYTGVEDIGGISHAAFYADTEHYFRKMINANAVNSPKHSVLARGYLLGLLASLSTGQGHSAYSGAVAQMVEYINLNWQQNISVASLAEKVNLSESRAAHLFSQTVGQSIHRYINSIKISNSKELLSDTEMSISEISSMVGYSDPLYFSRYFKSEVGVSPKNFRKMLTVVEE